MAFLKRMHMNSTCEPNLLPITFSCRLTFKRPGFTLLQVRVLNMYSAAWHPSDCQLSEIQVPRFGYLIDIISFLKTDVLKIKYDSRVWFVNSHGTPDSTSYRLLPQQGSKQLISVNNCTTPILRLHFLCLNNRGSKVMWNLLPVVLYIQIAEWNCGI